MRVRNIDQDPDSLHRLGGAEEQHYLKAGKLPVVIMDLQGQRPRSPVR